MRAAAAAKEQAMKRTFVVCVECGQEAGKYGQYYQVVKTTKTAFGRCQWCGSVEAEQRVKVEVKN